VRRGFGVRAGGFAGRCESWPRRGGVRGGDVSRNVESNVRIIGWENCGDAGTVVFGPVNGLVIGVLAAVTSARAGLPRSR
jgi:hypothetical protein